MKIEILKQTVVNGKTAGPGEVFDTSALSSRAAKILLATGKARRVQESAPAKIETADATPKTEKADAAPKAVRGKGK